jgi:predicted DCC family thiol-disulfide oxidoreductase YuxK
MSRLISYPLTVYYDASCPLCRAEMHALRDRDREGRLQLVDCSARDFDDTGLLAYGVTRDKLMEVIHAQDAYGRWLVGIDCYEAMYRAAGKERVAALWGNRWLRPMFRRAYPWVARHRQFLSRLCQRTSSSITSPGR